MNVLVSIIIRSFNDITYIEKTMAMMKKQTCRSFELINVDSGSTDGTYEIIKKYNTGQVYKIKPQDYVPGKVLNEAIGKARGEVIVFNNSDCIPQNEAWLETLIAPLLEDETIAAVYGRQIPRENAHPLVVKDYTRAFGSGTTSSRWRHFFSLATSAVRKSLIEEFPFNPEIQYSEDIEWSYRMKQLGKSIRYVPGAVVEHSHNYTIEQIKKRFFGEGFAEARIYGKEGLQRTLVFFFLKPYISETIRDIIYLIGNGKIGVIPYAFVYRFFQKLSTYRGYHAYFKQLVSDTGEAGN